MHTSGFGAARTAAIQAATLGATRIPFRVMEVSLAAMDVCKAMAESGNPNSVSDAGVGALCARTAVRGAFLNVRINAKDLTDQGAVSEFLERGQEIEAKAAALEEEILGVVARVMAS